jgi:hypothetical protein
VTETFGIILLFYIYFFLIGNFLLNVVHAPVLKITQPGNGVASSDNWGGGAYSYIRVHRP